MQKLIKYIFISSSKVIFILKRFERLRELIFDNFLGRKNTRNESINCLNQLLLNSKEKNPIGLTVGGSIPKDFRENLPRNLNFDLSDFQSNKNKCQFLDAHDLNVIKDESYDLYATSHMLEHTLSPLRVLQESYRTLKDEGCLLLIVPYYKRCQDLGGKPSSIEDLLNAKNPENTDAFREDDFLKIISNAIKAYSPKKDLSFNSLVSNLNFTMKNPYIYFHLWRFDFSNLIPIVLKAGFNIKHLSFYRTDLTIIAQKNLKEQLFK